MDKVVNINDRRETKPTREENELIELTGEMLSDARASINQSTTRSVPIAEISTLGAAIASLVPAFNTMELATGGLYQLANAGVGDVLKAAKGETFWGALKTSDGRSKMAKFAEADSLSLSAINPQMAMMAVALYAIEKEIKTIVETNKQILSFLEAEMESQVEADAETLMNILTKYKLNWDNSHFVESNHKMVLDVQRMARKNMLTYQKEVADLLSKNKIVVGKAKVQATLDNLKKMFEYYRLSHYIFSLASFLEIMLSGNFKEEYIRGISNEIGAMAHEYRELFGKCSMHLEKLSKSAIDTNVVKGLGHVGKAAGKAIGSIPVIKKGPVDEFLQDKGEHLKCNANDMENEAVISFATLGNPGTSVFINKMEDMIQIYNHTSQICFDKNEIFLLA